MNGSNDPLDRLLRSAAQAGEEPAEVTPPFGFETRVVAQWRGGQATPNGNGLNRLLRRVVLTSALVLTISGVAAVFELRNATDPSDAMTNDYAIADSAIQTEFSQ